MAKLKCIGGPADGREHEINVAGKVAFTCRKPDGAEFHAAVYRFLLVFDGYDDDIPMSGVGEPLKEASK